MREDLTDGQRDYVDYLVNCRSHLSLMIFAIRKAPKNILNGSDLGVSKYPKEIQDLWKDEMFDSFAKSDIKVWFKKNPMLSIVFFLELFALALLKYGFKINFRSSSLEEKVYERSTFSNFEKHSVAAGC